MKSWKLLAVIAAAVGLWTAPASATWIALAASGDGAYGFTVQPVPGQRDQRSEAIGQALSQCGKPSCRLEFVENMKCLAYAESRDGGYWYGDGYGHSERDAVNIALHGCQLGAPAGTCRVIRSACNDD